MVNDDAVSIEQILGALTELSAKDPALEATRKLAEEYKQKALLSVVRSLKQDLSEVETRVSRAGGRYSLSSNSDIKVALYRTHPECKILRIDGALIYLDAAYPARVAELKTPYGYKGGAARLVLASSLGEQVWNYVPRDVDIVRVGAGSEKTDWLVAKQFMPEDFSHGAGVEVISAIETYFATRDITINEVLICGHEVISTRQCIEDSINRVLAPTQHVRDKAGRIDGRTFVKLLRFQAISEVEGRAHQIERVGEIPEVSAFDLALHLDRALARSTKVAEQFLKNCLSYKLIKLSEVSVSEAKRTLNKRAPDAVKKLKHVGSTPPASKSRRMLKTKRRKSR